MAVLQAHDESNGLLLAGRVVHAARFLPRLRGLLFRAGLAPGEGLLLSPCGSIHTLGMRFPIDVLFLGAGGEVVRRLDQVAPWRIPPPVAGARMVLELAPGRLQGLPTGPGDRIGFRGVA